MNRTMFPEILLEEVKELRERKREERTTVRDLIR
ncbi:hypothetical protein J2S78_002368 [Salibacterium salarium]|nr:hypothetical protein [Salibacterium salarium]